MKWLLLICLVSTLHAADNSPWTWRDRDGVVRSKAELDAILQEHKKWVATDGKAGIRADLNGAHLNGADLDRADLSRAQLDRADLNGAHLSRADLDEADLFGAYLLRTDLSDAGLFEAKLIGAHMNGVHLNNAYLLMADLSGGDLTSADLTNVQFAFANLEGALYVPKRPPLLSGIAVAYGLGRLRWQGDPEPIYALRKSLFDAGFVKQAREVKAAIHRQGQSWLERVLFDWTCEWGANWLRPLAIAAILSLFCTLIYWIGMHFHTKSGLYLAATGERISTAKGKERVFRIAVYPTRTTPATDQLELNLEPKPQAKAPADMVRQKLSWEITALGTAFLFSLMSVFNIGFREFNFGRWIRMLQPREFDIRARGWMRTVSGIQSLIGVALVALSLLGYFGHPFE
jgi:hypothetical protein